MNIQHDEFGPEYVVDVHDPATGMRGFLVIDNTALGPGKGGIRMTPSVTVGEVFRLARTMTWKNALAGIPFGGAKAGLVVQKGVTGEDKKKLVQSFARALKPFVPKKYIAGPDVNSGEAEMQWFAEAVRKWNAATGKPKDFCDGGTCGLPHELGSTGFGVAHATRTAADVLGIALNGATVAIEGFGNVGTFAMKHLVEFGATVIAVSDSRGAVRRDAGLDYETLSVVKAKRSVADYPNGIAISQNELFGLPVDIIITAAVTDAINEKNKDTIKAKLVVEGSNIPMREEIENELWEGGVAIVPDFVANSGGVISSYAEYRGYDSERMFALVKEKTTKLTRAVLARAVKSKHTPRSIALELARARVNAAIERRRRKHP